MSDTLTPCPFCQEPIQSLATKCRYCKEQLPDGWSKQPDTGASAARAPSASGVVSPAMPATATVANPAPRVVVTGYARAAGVCALIAAILAVVIPIVGVLWFSPLAVVLGIIAMKGGAKGYGIAVLVIVTVNMVISPTFWLNIGAGSTMPGAGANRMVTYINVFGVLGMILMLFTGRVWTTVAAVVIGLIGVGIYGQISKPWVTPSDRSEAASTAKLNPPSGGNARQAAARQPAFQQLPAASTPRVRMGRPVVDYRILAAFDSVVQRHGLPLKARLTQIDALRARGLNLNSQSADGSTPVRTLMNEGAADLVAPLVTRGLRIDASSSDCEDQYWYAQSIALTPGGLAVLRELAKAGFKEDCLMTHGGAGGYKGFVCGVLSGAPSGDEDVRSRVHAVEYISSLGFNVGATCLGETIPDAIEKSPNYTSAMRQQLEPVAAAVRRLGSVPLRSGSGVPTPDTKASAPHGLEGSWAGQPGCLSIHASPSNGHEVVVRFGSCEESKNAWLTWSALASDSLIVVPGVMTIRKGQSPDTLIVLGQNGPKLNWWLPEWKTKNFARQLWK